MKKNSEITLLVPIYNEINSVEDSLKIISDFLSSRQNWNVIIINDGSSDGTKDILKNFLHERVKIIHLEKNYGYSTALVKGAKNAHTKKIGIIDADGTYPINDFDNLEKFSDDYKMVVGSRSKKDIPFIKRIPKFFIRLFSSYISDQNIQDFNSGMRIIDKKLFLSLESFYPKGFSLTTTITIIAASLNLKIKYVDIKYSKRWGLSKIHPVKDTINFFLIIAKLGIFFKPFKVYMPLILISFFIAFCLLFIRYIYGSGFVVLTISLFSISFSLLIFSMISLAISYLIKDNLLNKINDKD
jgi:glycosyltransferase involved in cell wall biosynthesis